VIGDGVRLWVSYHPIGPETLLMALRPVHTDVGTAHGLTDALTGLPNRALFTDRLSQALIRARTHNTLVSVVLTDIREMSVINAEHGFRRGDDLLVLLAGRLRDGLRADHTVARYAGHRFAVVAEQPTGTGQPIAARITELLGRSARRAAAAPGGPGVLADHRREHRRAQPAHPAGNPAGGSAVTRVHAAGLERVEQPAQPQFAQERRHRPGAHRLRGGLTGRRGGRGAEQGQQQQAANDRDRPRDTSHGNSFGGDGAGTMPAGPARPTPWVPQFPRSGDAIREFPSAIR